MTSPSPRKQSIQFSPESASHSNDGSQGPDALRKYREYPTPHPTKLAQAAGYFDGEHESQSGAGQGAASYASDSSSSRSSPKPTGSGSPPKPFLNRQLRPPEQPRPGSGSGSQPQPPKRAVLTRRSSTMDSEYFRDRKPFPARRPAPAQKYSDDSSSSPAPQPRRDVQAMLRRSSSMDSDFFERSRFERKFSEVEEGHPAPAASRDKPQGKKSQGVVAEIIQYGLRHGLGRLPSTVRAPRATGLFRVVSTQTLYERDPEAGREKKTSISASSGRKPTYLERCSILRERKQSTVIHHVEDFVARQKFLLRLAKALLSFGAPSHRIESQLHAAGEILDVNVAFVHLPNLIMATFMDSDTRTSETHFVRAGGRVALTKLQKIHVVYRDVLHDKIGVTEACDELKKIIQERPLYSIWVRCGLAFFCASIICVLSFGGSVVDMFISGLSASVLQYLGLNAASKSTIYANVYEISVSIVVSFIARLLSTLSGNIFCYSAISSAGVVLILPGFTILIAALELTSRNILCGSVRMVYAIIYTLFLGFGLTIGSDFYLLVSPQARRNLEATTLLGSQILHGFVINSNVSSTVPMSDLGGTFTFMETADTKSSHILKGCYRDPSWPWYRQPLPWWTMFFLVPLYSTCSSIQNLQSIRSIQLLVMVLFSCAAYTVNRVANYYISDRGDIVSAFGAFVIGLCGNAYSRVGGGTAFTSMVTGVLFLVPSAIGSGGGLIQNYDSSADRYTGTFALGIRMIQVAIGVTIGLFVSQILVYALGRRKSVAHFAF
ncbi:DUF1212-domain-containing protein [Lentinus brumalis]|uniref:DUF1212-domain-containing protein n=1 Tax=Lentinus brumalis TaxID=2498619 RepID=A0A371DEW8_9APHY|nr:DUF1212-domain-containing protein [Polyporus brumalis]